MRHLPVADARAWQRSIPRCTLWSSCIGSSPAFDGLVQRTGRAWFPLIGDSVRSAGWLLAIENLMVILDGVRADQAGRQAASVRACSRASRFPRQRRSWPGSYRHDPGREARGSCARTHGQGLRAIPASRPTGDPSSVSDGPPRRWSRRTPAWPRLSVRRPSRRSPRSFVGECYFAIDGVTRAGGTRPRGRSETRRTGVADYGALRSVLRETFPDRVLADGVHLASPDATDSKARLDELARSELDVDRLGAAYFERVKRSRASGGYEPRGGVGRTDAGDECPDQQPVLSGPDRVRLLPDVLPPLAEQQGAWSSAGRDSIADDIASWVEDGLEAISGVPGLWRVDVLTDLEAGDIDVGVLRFADVHNLELMRSNDGFLAEVDYVVLAEPSRMLATGQVGLRLLLSRCGNGRSAGVPGVRPQPRRSGGRPVTPAEGRHHRGGGVRICRTGRAPDIDLARGRAGTCTAAILPHITRYLGVGTEIAAVALKYQVAKVEWVGVRQVPGEGHGLDRGPVLRSDQPVR